MIGLIALMLLLTATAAAAQPARVVDGDTLELAGENVRLIGIDAPEGEQICQRKGREWACGDDATAALSELVEGAEVRCDVLGHDRWGRGLAVCFADDVELNRELVRQGWALAYYPSVAPSLDRNTTPSSSRRSRPSAGCGRGASCRRGSGGSGAAGTAKNRAEPAGCRMNRRYARITQFIDRVRWLVIGKPSRYRTVFRLPRGEFRGYILMRRRRL